jgi:hypothetical protein
MNPDDIYSGIWPKEVLEHKITQLVAQELNQHPALAALAWRKLATKAEMMRRAKIDLGLSELENTLLDYAIQANNELPWGNEDE